MWFVGVLLTALHFVGMIGISAASIVYSPLLYLPLVFFHAYNKKCPLTRLEQRLHGQDVTVMDPFLWVAGIERSSSNRETVTLLMSCLVFLVSVYSSMMSTV